jgi:DHA1 family tetracycline resistance protein-like MFS transporter
MPLYLVILIAFTGYSMMVTIFVPMLMYDRAFFGGEVSRAVKTTVIGVLLSLYPLGQLIGSPVIGAFSDRFGRKRVITISLSFTILFYLFIAASLQLHYLWLLMVSCFLCGLTESNVAIAQSSIADVSLPEDRGRLFAYLYSAESIGYIAGPLFGGLMAVHFGYAFPFWMVLGLLVIAYVWLAASFKDPFVPKTDAPVDYFKTFTNLATVFTDVPIRRVYFVNFLLYLSAFGFWRVIQIYMVDKWGFDVGEVTFYYSYLAVLGTIANLFIFAPLSRKFTLKTFIVLTAVIGGLFVAAVVVPESETSYWFTAGPATVFLVMTMAACSAYLSGLVSGERQGRVLGNNLAIQVGAESMSALLGGFLAAMLIPLPLLTYGLVAVLGGLLLITYKGTNTNSGKS